MNSNHNISILIQLPKTIPNPTLPYHAMTNQLLWSLVSVCCEAGLVLVPSNAVQVLQYTVSFVSQRHRVSIVFSVCMCICIYCVMRVIVYFLILVVFDRICLLIVIYICFTLISVYIDGWLMGDRHHSYVYIQSRLVSLSYSCH